MLQRPGIISFAAQTAKGGAICVSVQQFLRLEIAVMVAGHEMVHLVCFHLFTGLPFLSYPGPNSRLLGPHISSFSTCQNLPAFFGGISGFQQFPGIPQKCADPGKLFQESVTYPEAWNNFPCCTNPQRWGHMCHPKTPNSCNGCRSWNGPSCVFLVAQYLFTGLSFLSYPGPNSRLLGPHISSFSTCQNLLACLAGRPRFEIVFFEQSILLEIFSILFKHIFVWTHWAAFFYCSTLHSMFSWWLFCEEKTHEGVLGLTQNRLRRTWERKGLQHFWMLCCSKFVLVPKTMFFSRAFFYTFAMMACQKKTQKYMQEKSLWCIFCCFPIQILCWWKTLVFGFRFFWLFFQKLALIFYVFFLRGWSKGFWGYSFSTIIPLYVWHGFIIPKIFDIVEYFFENMWVVYQNIFLLFH